MKEKITIKETFKQVIDQAYSLSEDVGELVESALYDATLSPMSPERAHQLLSTVMVKLIEGFEARGNHDAAREIRNRKDSIIKKAMEMRTEEAVTASPSNRARVVSLHDFNDVAPAIVHPRPTFHRREVPMKGGGVRTTDIKLWENNQRLDIHIAQFKSENGRDPSAAEVLDIMLSRMALKGKPVNDQFEIKDLALSIANNGVRVPPIIDQDGTLLDGNRRVAACYYILNSDDFNIQQKKKAETIYVWQLTEHATADDRRAVVVSLNFENDLKQKWDDYVKANIIYEEWQAILAMETNIPGTSRVAQIKRELAEKFGYGNETEIINRYLKMVQWSSAFERFMVDERGKDPFEVKHQASKYFQYFDEMSKGISNNGVAQTLTNDENFRGLVFDLLFENKIKSWELIRYLKYVNDDVKDSLHKAHQMDRAKDAADIVEDKLQEAKRQSSEARVGNPNQRIQVFTHWLESLPIAAFRDDIKPENLLKLHSALQLVDHHVLDLGIKDQPGHGG